MKAFLSLLLAAATTLGAAQAQSTGSGSQSGNAPARKSAASGKPTSGAAGKVVVSPGGQGHNSVPDPKGKILVAPSVTTTGKGAAKPAASKQ